MSSIEWSWASASVIGSSHLTKGVPCQDRVACEVLRDAQDAAVLLVVASDGAGSASLAHEGAQAVCDEIRKLARALLMHPDGLAGLDSGLAQEWLLRLRDAIEARASQAGVPACELASTMVVALVAPARRVFLQVGDGAIVVSDGSAAGGYRCVFWPERGEYANVTVFVTSADAASHLQVRVEDDATQRLAVFTDGIQSLALRMSERVPHAPFFDGMFAAIQPMGAGDASDSSRQLGDFLASPRVCDRTDDDKSLVLAMPFAPSPVGD